MTAPLNQQTLVCASNRFDIAGDLGDEWFLERNRTLGTMFVFATSNQITSLAFEADDSLFSKRKFNFFAVLLCSLDQGRLEPLGILCRQHSRPGSYTFLPRRSAVPSFVVD